MEIEEIAAALPGIIGRWGYEIKGVRPDLVITGSPERALHREILETTTGELMVLEQLPARMQAARERQAAILRCLAQQGLSEVRPWLPCNDNAMGCFTAGYYWQLRRWEDGLSLPRETYADEGWRGEVLADYLVAQKQASHCSQMPGQNEAPFSLHHYIHTLLPQVRLRMPALETDLKPIIQELHPFLEREAHLATDFCHGDFHPGNVVWGNRRINAVIDWEFCGRKAAGYDMANLLGCLGNDSPANLTGPLALSFIQRLRQAEFLDNDGWETLPELIAALRFAWLREWVAQRNTPLICQELDFIWLILDNRDLLRARWN